MKQAQFLSVKSTLIALTLIAVVALSTVVLRAQSGQETNGQTEAQSESYGSHGRWRELQSQQFEGSWDIVVTPVVPPGVPQPPSFVAHATVSRGGGYFGSDRTRPFSKQHGTWEHLGGRNFAYILKEDLFDPMGNFDGIITVRVRVTLTGKNTFVGVANGERRDANDNLVFNRCTTVKGTRIRLEPLSAQCQNITPPQ